MAVARKRKASAKIDPTSLDFLLTHPKSPLVNLELSTLINGNTWTALSPNSRNLLSTILPLTAFRVFRATLNPNHPASRQRSSKDSAGLMDIDNGASATGLELSLFTDPFFEASARTFQDNLFSGWLTPSHEALIREYMEQLRNGEMHAPWKDAAWGEEHPVVERSPDEADGLAGEASAITLRDLIKHSVIRVGDVLAYRRHFPQFNRIVAKDALVDSIHPSTRSFTVLVAPSTQTHLPLAQLGYPATSRNTSTDNSDLSLLSMTIVNPSQLESALLDTDNTIQKSKRPKANAWKSIGVWRLREEGIPGETTYAEGSKEAARGYREYRGTLFYLRGCFYDDL